MKHPIRLAACAVTTALCGALATLPAPAGATPSASYADPAVVTDWNATAFATIVTDGRSSNPEAFLWYGVTQAAVHNAVNGITHRYPLYAWHRHGPAAASPAAAAAAAAHRVLLTFFPGSQARLDAAYDATLARVPDGPSQDQGIRYGEAAAQRVIDLRAHDGRDSGLTFDRTAEPGVWRPTPPAYAPMLAPWLGQVRPLVLPSSSSYVPGPPPGLGTARYARDLNESAAVGARTGSTRTPEMTQTALFFSDTPPAIQAGLRDLVARRGLDISDAARLFAAVDVSLADTIITIWAGKHRYGFWRPVTGIALADQDGNAATSPVAGWQPLVTTPPYPEYPAGTPSVFSSLAQSLSRLLGSDDVDITIRSAAAGAPEPPVARHYDSGLQLRRDVIDGRVWGGVHFRFTDEVSALVGQRVTDYVLDHAFPAS